MSKSAKRPLDSLSSIRRLRAALVLFAVLLLLPMSLVFGKAYQQIQDETFLQYRNAADSLLDRANKRLDEIIATEERRTFSEYSFLDQRYKLTPSNSPLSFLPLQSSVPGIEGYFQVNPSGAIESPLLPPPTSIDPGYVFQRRQILSSSSRQANLDLVTAKLAAAGIYSGSSKRLGEANGDARKREQYAAPASKSKASAQSAVALEDEVVKNSMSVQQSVSSLNLDSSQLDRYERSNKVMPLAGNVFEFEQRRKERTPTKGSQAALSDEIAEVQEPGYAEEGGVESEAKASRGSAVTETDLTAEELEVDPFQLLTQPDMTFIFQRKVWRNRARYAQGFVVNGAEFLRTILEEVRSEKGFEGDLSLVVTKNDQALLEVEPVNGSEDLALLKSSYYGKKNAAVAVVKGRLAAPFDSLELLAALPQGLPQSASFSVVMMLGVAILITLAVGLAVIYRMSLTRIHLAQKKSDFVSAVSHELKTPLTSIRMYAEMLREGWVSDEEKKKSYYNFIFTESERLSRLIANVLQLSKISQSERALTLKTVTLSEALDLVATKVRSQADAAGFTIEVSPASEDTTIEIEEDALVQIGINLVDNAIKFSRGAARQQIQLGSRISGGTKTEATIYIRDFGAGVAAHEQRRIFELFYRAESELTRETPGTGIGLALVKDLANQMGARVDMANQSPGAEFQIVFEARALQSK